MVPEPGSPPEKTAGAIAASGATGSYGRRFLSDRFGRPFGLENRLRTHSVCFFRDHQSSSSENNGSSALRSAPIRVGQSAQKNPLYFSPRPRATSSDHSRSKRRCRQFLFPSETPIGKVKRLVTSRFPAQSLAPDRRFRKTLPKKGATNPPAR